MFGCIFFASTPLQDDYTFLTAENPSLLFAMKHCFVVRKSLDSRDRLGWTIHCLAHSLCFVLDIAFPKDRRWHFRKLQNFHDIRNSECTIDAGSPDFVCSFQLICVMLCETLVNLSVMVEGYIGCSEIPKNE